MVKIPPYLKKGQTIGITCPAGYMPADKAAACIGTLQEWGYEVKVGKTLGSESTNYFSGTDEERAGELQAMLDDKNIDAILFGRGGYGMTRIIDRLDFKKFKKKPKWLIGFSDITVMHTHLYSRYNISSIHGPMAAAFNTTPESEVYIDLLRKTLIGKKTSINTVTHVFNKKGTATAPLIGGNLCLLAHVIGSPSDFSTKNKILFIEEVGEYLYNADRLLQQLKRSGKLAPLAGLIVGGFTDMKDTERPFGKTIESIISDAVAEYDYPVCFGFPVSHAIENVPLKIGVTYQLKVGNKKVSLKEL